MPSGSPDGPRPIAFVGLLLAALLIPGVAGATELESVLGPKVDEKFAYIKAGEPGGTVAVVLDGRVAYQKSYGLAKVASAIPNGPSTRFYVASVSKEFTAMCALILQEQGLFSFEDSVRTYVPELPAAYAGVKIRHLVHMMSGVPYVMQEADLERADSVAYLWGRLTGLPTLAATPGTVSDYSNTAYFLLGGLIERRTSKTLRQVASELIFSKLGMSESLYKDNATEVIPNLADGHQPNNTPFATIATVTGPGGVVTTIGDMVKWDQNFFANALGTSPGDQRLINQAETIGLFNSGIPNGLNYAAGLFRDFFEGYRQVWHDGAAVGFRTSYYRYPELKFSVIVFTNRSDQITQTRAQSITSLFLNNVRFANDPPPAGTLGAAYGFRYSASGAPKPVFTVESGALPAGLALRPDGLLSGVLVQAGTFTGTVRADNGLRSSTQAFAITVAPAAGPTLAFEPGAFVEAAANDGTFDTAKGVTLVGGGTFAEAAFQPSTHYTVANLPAGLSLAVTRDSATQVSLRIMGTATQHQTSNGVANVRLSFLDAAFNGPAASGVAGSTRPDLSVEFRDSELVLPDVTFREGAANDGAIPEGKIGTLVGGATFASGPFVAGTHYVGSNVPAGLRLDVARDSATQVTLKLAQAATSHQASDSVSTLGLTFLNAAFAGGNAAVVTNAARSNLAISFADPVNTPVTVTYQQGVNGYLDTRDLGTRSDELGLSKGWNNAADVLCYVSVPTAFGLNYFVRFRKLGLPPGALVSSADLAVSAVFSKASGLTGGYVTKDWDPMADLPELGWTRFADGRLWTQPGGASDVLQGKTIAYAFSGSINVEQRLTLALDKTVVQGWVTDPATNLGVLLRPTVDDAMIRIRASSFFTPAARPRLTITYKAPTAPVITSAAPTATGAVGSAYAFQVVTTASSNVPTTFTATGLPALGLTMSATGLISGTPSATGTVSGTVMASNGTLPNATQAFTISINPAPGTPAITSAPTASGAVGVPFSFVVTGDHSPTSYAAPGLPPGLVIDTRTGAITGMPTTAGVKSVTVSATNAIGTGTAALLFSISQGTQAIAGFVEPAPHRYGDAPFSLGTLTGGGSGAPVVVVSDAPEVATIEGSLVTVKGAGTAVLTATQQGSSDYLPATPVSRTLVVGKAPLAVTAKDAIRLYGTVNPTFEGKIEGLIGSDRILATWTSTATATTPAGTYGPATPEAIVPVLQDEGARLRHYALTEVRGTLTISRADQQIVGFAPLEVRTWGDEDFELQGVVGGASGAPVVLSSRNERVARVIGTTVTIVGAGTTELVATQAGAPNHAPAPEISRSLTVRQAPLAVIAEDADRAFGEANPEFTGRVIGLVRGDLLTATWTSSATQATPAGLYGPEAAEAIAGEIDDLEGRLANYDLTSERGTLLIYKAQQQLVGVGPFDARTYGDQPIALPSVTGGASELPVLWTSDAPEVAIVEGASIRLTGAGAATLTVTQEGNANFEPAGPVSQILTVKKAPLEARADDANRRVGQANPEFTGTLVGVVGEDAITAKFTSSAEAATPVGVYGPGLSEAIVPTLADPKGRLVHYALTTRPGTLTITGLIPQVITGFEPFGPHAVGDPPFAISGVEGGASGKAIVFSSNDPTVATVAGKMVTIVGPGKALVTATQAGNADYAAAEAVSQVLTVAECATCGNPTDSCGSCAAAPGTSAFALLLALAVRRRRVLRG